MSRGKGKQKKRDRSNRKWTKKKVCPVNSKRQFPSRLHCRIRIADVERHAKQPLYAYQCKNCGYWHMTRRPVFQDILLLNLGL